MNKPVNFELAKLLQEKNFDEECTNYFDSNEELNFHIGYKGDVWKNSEIGNGLPYLKNDTFPCFSAPTIAEVIMWLYEKYGIWIEVYMDDDTTFGYLISKVTIVGRVDFPLQRGFNSPTKAYEVGIEWILKNRI
jgi:hypothetical protein